MKMLFALSLFFGFTSTSYAAQVCFSHNKFTATSIQIMGLVNASSTTPEVFDITSVLDYDADAKMFSAQSTRFNDTSGTYSNFTIIQDFNSNKMYISGPGFCTEQSLDGTPFFGTCLPDHATPVRSYTAAGGQVTVHVYTGNLMGNKFYFHITDNGEPFMYSSYGQPGGVYQMDTRLFVNVRMGVLSDPNVFQNVGCHGQQVVPVGR